MTRTMIGRIIARPILENQETSHEQAIVMISSVGSIRTHGPRFFERSMERTWCCRKINDIFNGQGITESVRTKSNMDGVDQLLNVMKKSLQVSALPI